MAMYSVDIEWDQEVKTFDEGVITIAPTIRIKSCSCPDCAHLFTYILKEDISRVVNEVTRRFLPKGPNE